MRFTFDYDRAEFIRAQRMVAKHGESRFMRRAALVLGGLAVAAAIASALAPDGAWAVTLARLVPWLLIVALWFLLFRRFLGPAAARQYEKQYQDWKHPIVAALNEAEFEVTAFSGTTLRRWDVMPRAVETREFLLFFIAKQFAMYLPKRVIPADDLPAVRRFLREKLGDRAQLMDAA
ncbi:MAG TPA: YcxB family protein [Longimicrobium sp.]|nr:YcxB family protein [Longimicrobium sp.]